MQEITKGKIIVIEDGPLLILDNEEEGLVLRDWKDRNPEMKEKRVQLFFNMEHFNREVFFAKKLGEKLSELAQEFVCIYCDGYGEESGEQDYEPARDEAYD